MCSKHGYSITSLAVASSASGTVRPSALAALRLITNSNSVGACGRASRLEDELASNGGHDASRAHTRRSLEAACSTVLVASLAAEIARVGEAVRHITLQ
jgi:hypothetical protein